MGPHTFLLTITTNTKSMNKFEDFDVPALLYVDSNNNVLARGRCPFSVGANTLDISFDRRNRFVEEMLRLCAEDFTDSKSIADLTTCFMVKSGAFSETPLAGTNIRACNAEHQTAGPLVIIPSLTAVVNNWTKSVRSGNGAATLAVIPRIRLTYQGTTRVDWFPESFELEQGTRRVRFQSESEVLDYLTWSLLPKRPYCDKNPNTLRELVEFKLFPKPKATTMWEKLGKLQSL